MVVTYLQKYVWESQAPGIFHGCHISTKICLGESSTRHLPWLSHIYKNMFGRVKHQASSMVVTYLQKYVWESQAPGIFHVCHISTKICLGESSTRHLPWLSHIYKNMFGRVKHQASSMVVTYLQKYVWESQAPGIFHGCHISTKICLGESSTRHLPWLSHIYKNMLGRVKHQASSMVVTYLNTFQSFVQILTIFHGSLITTKYLALQKLSMIKLDCRWQ